MARRPLSKLPTGYNQAAADTGLPMDVLAGNIQAKGRAAGQKTGAAALTMIHRAATLAEDGQAGEARGLLEAAQDLMEELFRWKDAYLAVGIDRDRQANWAAERAESCAHHGQEIRSLKAQLAYAVQSRDRAERARRVLFGWYTECVKFVENARGRRGVAGLPAPNQIINWMGAQLPKVRAAHESAVNPPPPGRNTAE
jgi:hypothetical protein